MMYRDYITKLKDEFVGKNIEFNGQSFCVVDVDYNGIIHIILPTKHNNTTAIYEPFQARKHLIV